LFDLGNSVRGWLVGPLYLQCAYRCPAGCQDRVRDASVFGQPPRQAVGIEIPRPAEEIEKPIYELVVDGVVVDIRIRPVGSLKLFDKYAELSAEITAL